MKPVEFKAEHLLKSEQTKGIDPNLIIQIAAQLLPVVLQYGIPLVEKVLRAIQEDPNLPADPELLKKTVIDRLDEATELNNKVLNDTE